MIGRLENAANGNLILPPFANTEKGDDSIGSPLASESESLMSLFTAFSHVPFTEARAGFSARNWMAGDVSPATSAAAIDIARACGMRAEVADLFVRFIVLIGKLNGLDKSEALNAMALRAIGFSAICEACQL